MPAVTDKKPVRHPVCESGLKLNEHALKQWERIGDLSEPIRWNDELHAWHRISKPDQLLYLLPLDFLSVTSTEIDHVKEHLDDEGFLWDEVKEKHEGSWWLVGLLLFANKTSLTKLQLRFGEMFVQYLRLLNDTDPVNQYYEFVVTEDNILARLDEYRAMRRWTDPWKRTDFLGGN